MADMDKKIDPFDVAALEKSLNDSATRVSTIWVSFLIFSLYLVTAAGTVTHRQLFLQEPTKLPVLNIELPLWWFFLLAPIFFVVLHAYVLMQVLLLGRTAAAYDRALQQIALSPADDAQVRQRLANTLFAQIFAGSPRERAGLVGAALKLMMWLTLAIAPMLVLLVFQFRFLPYHSNFVTWSHRVLIFLELATVFLLWPMVLDAAREAEWRRSLVQPVSLTIIVLLFLISVIVATFPGEPAVNLLTGNPMSAVRCKRWFAHYYDRLDLTRVDVVDDEKLEKIEKFSKAADLPPYLSERTRDLRGRDLNCGVFDFADLRRVDLTGARLRGASLRSARLQGATLTGVQSQDAALDRAKLAQAFLEGAQFQGASLDAADLPEAILNDAQLQGASLDNAELQGASLQNAQLQGASLVWVELQGASLDGAGLQGAAFDNDRDRAVTAAVRHSLSQIRGAAFTGAKLQGASFAGARLQGAFVDGAHLQGASLAGAELQGASFDDADLSHALLSKAGVWRARPGICARAHVSDLKFDTIGSEDGDEAMPLTPENIARYIERSTSSIPEGEKKEQARKRMRNGLVVDPAKDDSGELEKAWRNCEAGSKGRSQEQFEKDQTEFLRELICDASGNLKIAADRVISNWAFRSAESGPTFARELSNGLFGGSCPGLSDLSEATKTRIRSFLLQSERAKAAEPNR